MREQSAVPLPRSVLVIATAAALFAVVPIAGLVSRMEWSALAAHVSSPAVGEAMWLSLRTSVCAAAACVVLGVPLGLALTRLRGATRQITRAVLLAPLVLPPVVSGLGLLYALGRRGLLGRVLEAGGVTLSFTTAAVIIAQTFVALPFMVAAVEAAAASRGDRAERIATSFGASRWRVLRDVTLPAITPAIATGAVLAFARALGEFGATLTFAGSAEGVTRTAPLLIYLARESDPQAAVALGLVLLVVAVTIVAVALGPMKGTRR